MFWQKKVAFFELEQWEKEYIKKNLKGFSIKFFDESLTENNAAKVKDVEAIGIFIYSHINKEILDRMPKLKFIAAMSTGYDHIDLEECKKRNISISNVPYYGENTVAEHTFALILTLTRKIYDSIKHTKKGNFSAEGLRGFDLKGKTIGLVGTGHISAHVARIADGFEMNILGYDINQNKELIEKYRMKYVSLEELMKQSDIISLHLPLNEHTKHIIDAKNIKLMKSTAIIINTARGALIDTHALVDALHKQKIGGAGLDVLEEENSIKEEKQLLSAEFNSQVDMKTLIADHVLLNMDNVIITPHNAFNSEEALKRILDTTIENIKGYKQKNAVNAIK